MVVVKNKKIVYLLSSILLLTSCKKGITGVPSPLCYMDVLNNHSNYSDMLTNDKENNRFIYTVEVTNEYALGDETHFDTWIGFYNYSNDYFFYNECVFKVFDSYSNSYLEPKSKEGSTKFYSITNVEKRELYLYYDDIYEKVKERVFENYDYVISLIGGNRFTNDRSKTMWD